jgi:two-component system LytT family response regulator
MPGRNAFDVIRDVGVARMPAVIFVTAYDRYAVEAFEVHAVDYLRKPYTNARFASALTHARWRVHARRGGATGSVEVEGGARGRSRYSPVLATVQAYRIDPRVAVRDAATGFWHIIDQNDIDWIEGDGSARVRLHVGPTTYVWRKTLSELEHTLDPRVFLRIHRSYIVNTGRIKCVKPLQRGEYTVILDEKTVFDTGRTYHNAIERFLGVRG